MQSDTPPDSAAHRHCLRDLSTAINTPASVLAVIPPLTSSLAGGGRLGEEEVCLPHSPNLLSFLIHIRALPVAHAGSQIRLTRTVQTLHHANRKTQCMEHNTAQTDFERRHSGRSGSQNVDVRTQGCKDVSVIFDQSNRPEADQVTETSPKKSQGKQFSGCSRSHGAG